MRFAGGGGEPERLMLTLQHRGVEAWSTVIATDDEPFGDQLKHYFDDLTSGPVPDRLTRLTEALEQALERGDLPSFGFRA
jgi:hypothetical protein